MGDAITNLAADIASAIDADALAALVACIGPVCAGDVEAIGDMHRRAFRRLEYLARCDSMGVPA